MDDDVPLLDESTLLSVDDSSLVNLDFESTVPNSIAVGSDIREQFLYQTGVQQGKDLYSIKTHYESLDYEHVQSTVRQLEQRQTYKKSSSWIEIERWICCFLIGVSTGGVGVLITIAIDLISSLKRTILNSMFNVNSNVHSVVPVLVWVSWNFVCVFIAGCLCAYIAPVAAGSGIPQIKCFLNGVKVPRVIRLKTLFVKMSGIILAVVGGLACGKEGPMVHAGAVLAGGISQGQSISLKFTSGIFEHFRDDHEKRDFVAAGAAAGVSAAFGAPVGGVLFALEEAASFWNQALTWRIFFTSVISFMTLDYGLSALDPNLEFGNLTGSGLLNFGKFENNEPWFWYELPIFILMGIIGGLLGAGFIQLNKVITIERIRLNPGKFARAMEAALIAVLSGTLMILLLYLNPYCREIKCDIDDDLINEFNYLRMNCKPNEYNTMSLLSFGTPEIAVKGRDRKREKFCLF